MEAAAFWFNVFEASLWICLGIAALAAGRSRRRRAGLAVVLIAFGISDLVETQTGAWWRPPWLLAWKAACVAILAGYAIAWLRARRR